MFSPNNRREFFSIFAVTAIVLFLTTVPYLYAWWSAGTEYVFGGFLLNPIDGNTYLAKMYQGQQGEWYFKLPFTAEPGKGALIFLFYLFLGHISHLTGLTLPVVFHIARVAGIFCLLAALLKFFRMLFEDSRWRVFAFSLTALGSGVGWLALPFGGFTSDFWVAEAYPFLSMYSSPHFCFGLALLLWLVTPAENLPARDEISYGNHSYPVDRSEWTAILLGLALSILMPFGVLLVCAILTGVAVFEYSLIHDRWLLYRSRSPLRRAIAAAFGGSPFAIYYLWTVASNPVFAGWNAQNQTPSPPLWDLILSMSPALILAVLGGCQAIRRKTPGDLLTVIWAFSGLFFLYLPVGLQRRFMMGYYIPIVALATVGLEKLLSGQSRKRNLLPVAVFTFSLLTNLMILLTANHGIQTKDPLLYLTWGEYAALNWINEHAPSDALVLSSPQMGLFIPAYTGRRVIYGHPFETLDAKNEKTRVLDFYSGGSGVSSSDEQIVFLANRKVDYLFYGPREKAIGEELPEDHLQVVFTESGVTLFVVINH